MRCPPPPFEEPPGRHRRPQYLSGTHPCIRPVPGSRGVTADMTLELALSRNRDSVPLDADEPYYRRVFDRVIRTLQGAAAGLRRRTSARDMHASTGWTDCTKARPPGPPGPAERRARVPQGAPSRLRLEVTGLCSRQDERGARGVQSAVGRGSLPRATIRFRLDGSVNGSEFSQVSSHPIPPTRWKPTGCRASSTPPQRRPRGRRTHGRVMSPQTAMLRCKSFGLFICLHLSMR